MMQKYKTIFFIAFLAIILYTGYGILKLGEQGGPCNAGIAIIILIPVLLVCLRLLATTIAWLIHPDKTDFRKPVSYLVVSFVIWTSIFYLFAEDHLKDAIQYLGLFEIVNLFLLLFSVVQAKKCKIDESIR